MLLPGEVEARAKLERLHIGIPVSPGVLDGIYGVTDPLRVPRPTPLAARAGATGPKQPTR